MENTTDAKELLQAFTALPRNNDTAAFFLTRIPKRENQFGETRLCHFGVPFGLRLSIQHFLAFIPLSRSCTSSWSIVGSVQTSIWLSYVYGISVGMCQRPIYN